MKYLYSKLHILSFEARWFKSLPLNTVAVAQDLFAIQVATLPDGFKRSLQHELPCRLLKLKNVKAKAVVRLFEPIVPNALVDLCRVNDKKQRLSGSRGGVDSKLVVSQGEGRS